MADGRYLTILASTFRLNIVVPCYSSRVSLHPQTFSNALTHVVFELQADKYRPSAIGKALQRKLLPLSAAALASPSGNGCRGGVVRLYLYMSMVPPELVRLPTHLFGPHLRRHFLAATSRPDWTTAPVPCLRYHCFTISIPLLYTVCLCLFVCHCVLIVFLCGVVIATSWLWMAPIHVCLSVCQPVATSSR